MGIPEENKRAGVRKQSNERTNQHSSSTSHRGRDPLASGGREIAETPPAPPGASAALPPQGAPGAPPAPGNSETRAKHGPAQRRLPVGRGLRRHRSTLSTGRRPSAAKHCGPARARGAERPPAARPRGPPDRSCPAPTGAKPALPRPSRAPGTRRGTRPDPAPPPVWPGPAPPSVPLRPRPRRGSLSAAGRCPERASVGRARSAPAAAALGGGARAALRAAWPSGCSVSAQQP
ncbi:uncharacterized protein [Agelaius tricolor]|uniref:uncharacterized protein n=1 Tax=Agelaius tricolor TaxID=9191 RepID=UPI0039F2295C